MPAIFCSAIYAVRNILNSLYGRKDEIKISADGCFYHNTGIDKYIQI